ncbi:TolC family protein [Burkholderia orbicola]|uniref:TolC family protein n=1 Tax=Burkholderia orbicola TaxID=2978683 RepID=UPI002FE2C435
MRELERRRPLAIWLGMVIGSVGVCACALQPAYLPPPTTTATGRHAEVAHGGKVENLIDWWSRFDDPAVGELIRVAEAGSPTLAKAVARISSARATLASNSADAWPTLTGSASIARAKSNVSTGSATFTTLATTRSGGLDASWELDLFGKARSARESSQALLQARIDDWHDARISLAAEAADDYVQYRACRQLVRAYQQSAASYAKTEKSTNAAVTAGMSAASDGYLAEANTADMTPAVNRDWCSGFPRVIVQIS